jgi:hypothetical protein
MGGRGISFHASATLLKEQLAAVIGRSGGITVGTSASPAIFLSSGTVTNPFQVSERQFLLPLLRAAMSID